MLSSRGQPVSSSARGSKTFKVDGDCRNYGKNRPTSSTLCWQRILVDMKRKKAPDPEDEVANKRHKPEGDGKDDRTQVAAKLSFPPTNNPPQQERDDSY